MAFMMNDKYSVAFMIVEIFEDFFFIDSFMTVLYIGNRPTTFVFIGRNLKRSSKLHRGQLMTTMSTYEHLHS